MARNQWTHTENTVPQSHSAKNARLSAEVRTRRLETKSETFSFSCRDVEHVVCAAASFKSHRFSHCAVTNHTVSRQLHCMFSSLLDVCGFPLSQRSLSLRRARGRSLNSAPRLLITPQHKHFFCVTLRLTTLLFVLRKNNPTGIFCRVKKKPTKTANNMKNSTKTRRWLKLLTTFRTHTSLHDSGYWPVVKCLVFLLRWCHRRTGNEDVEPEKKNHILWQPLIESGIVFRLSGTFHDCFLNRRPVHRRCHINPGWVFSCSQRDGFQRESTENVP